MAVKGMAVESETVPLVSVCIPVRNGSGQLPHTLANLLVHTTYPADRVEVLVGNHGSTDSTAEIVAGFASRFEGVRLVDVPFESENRSQVRNRLIALARGELLIFIDHDVLVCDDFVSSHVAAHEQHPGALVAGLTFGKGYLKQEIDSFLPQLDLNHISASLPLLERNQDLADFRTSPGMLRVEGDVFEISSAVAPFRFFWTCNVSARRADIDACGLFDEAYVGWGLEDDDFAQQFRVQGRALVFSRSAWGFHIPHDADALGHIISWRRNFETIFAKFRTRELEYFWMYYGAELPLAVGRLEGTLAMLRQFQLDPLIDAAAKRLPAPRGRRLMHFLSDSGAARRLALTDALDPYVPLSSRERAHDGVQFWPFFGFKTLFSPGEIAEVVVLGDLFMFIDRNTLVQLLAEVARFSKRLVVCFSQHCTTPAHEFIWQQFRQVVSLFHFEQVIWLDLQQASSHVAVT